MVASHLYVVAQGSYRSGAAAGGKEIWQTGFRVGIGVGNGEPASMGTLDTFGVVARPRTRNESTFTVEGNWTTEMGISDLDPVDWLADQVGPAWGGFVSSAIFCSDVQLDTVKVYPIARDTGKVEPAPPYAQGTPVTLTYKAGSHPSGAGSQGLPLNASVVASLRTQQIGRRGRGRMYLPPAPTSYMGNMLLTSAAQTAIGTATRLLLEGCRLNVSTNGVWAYPIVTGGTYRDYAMVTRVLVGNVVDSQNRRRRGIDETYHSVDVDPLA